MIAPTLKRGLWGLAACLWLAGCGVYWSHVSLAQGAEVALRVGDAGLESLVYNGQNFVARGALQVHGALLRAADGTVHLASLGHTVSVDAVRQEITHTYEWGEVRVAYAASESRLGITVTITNRSLETLQSLHYEPLVLRLPSPPVEHDGGTPHLASNVGSPSVVRMSFEQGTVALVNEDIAGPLMIGFPWALDRPANTVYPIRVSTGREENYHPALPYIDRPVPPGATDTHRLSLRFAPPKTSLRELAGDVYERFAATYPSRLAWPDRRPIGALFLSTASAGWHADPRGWLQDPTIDVLTPEGRALFRERVMAYADNSIRILKDMHAQGMVTWDIEGQEFPHPISYVGDPRLVESLAPEMSGVIDEYFQRFRDAGMRVGVCIRPQRFMPPGEGVPAQQVSSPNAAEELIEKIAYAKHRWGATLFYIDSNGLSLWPMDANLVAQVFEAHPDVLLIPEHENSRYYAKSAPFHLLRQGFVGTPDAERYINPHAFSVIYTADGPVDAQTNALIESVRRGDILLYRSWYDDPDNAKLKRILDLATDTQAPEVYVTYPLNGSTVKGRLTLRAVAEDNRAVTGLQFQINWKPFGDELTAAPYETGWDTTALPDGFYNVKAVARDGSGLTGTSNVTVTVCNSCP